MIEMLAGGACVGLGYLLGRLSRKQRPSQPSEAKPVCGCGDHFALHDEREDGTRGRCREIHRHVVKKGEPILESGGGWVIGRTSDEYEFRSCPCPGYFGPEPLPQYVPSELST